MASGSGTDKPAGYYGNERPDLVEVLPRPLGRVLDVGCGQGAVGRGIRAEADHLTGVELFAEAAGVADEIYDEVLVGRVEDRLDEAAGPFDTVLCYDVLEHLADPYAVLSRLETLMRPGAHIHVSVPNARQIGLVRDLLFRGTFGYTEWGHRDVTHLRWFTRRDLNAALELAGFELVSNGHPPLGRSKLLDRATRGRATELVVAQISALARKPS